MKVAIILTIFLLSISCTDRTRLPSSINYIPNIKCLDLLLSIHSSKTISYETIAKTTRKTIPLNSAQSDTLRNMQHKYQSSRSLLNSRAIPENIDILLHDEGLYGLGTGDFYKISRTTDRDTSMIIFGDVAGHGNWSALESTAMHKLLEADDIYSSLSNRPASDVISYIDKIYQHNGLDFALSAATFNHQTGNLSFAQTGNLPGMLVIRKNGDVEFHHQAGGFIGDVYKRYSDNNGGSLSLTLKKGEIFILLSDGVIDTSPEDSLVKAQYHLLQRVKELTKSSSYTLDELKSIIRPEILKAKDDETMLIFKWLGK